MYIFRITLGRLCAGPGIEPETPASLASCHTTELIRLINIHQHRLQTVWNYLVTNLPEFEIPARCVLVKLYMYFSYSTCPFLSYDDLVSSSSWEICICNRNHIQLYITIQILTNWCKMHITSQLTKVEKYTSGSRSCNYWKWKWK